MTKQEKTCKIHNIPLKYSEEQKVHYCPKCLQAAYESWQSQQEAVKRYRDSEKGKTAQEKYEKSEKGQTARQRYLKSEKYKERRKEYNQRLKESLIIARAAKLERPTVERDVERIRVTELSPLIQDILEYQDTMGKNPTTTEVKEWAMDVYKTAITAGRAKALIEEASKKRR